MAVDEKTIKELVEDWDVTVTVIHESQNAQITHEACLRDTIADVLEKCVGERLVSDVLKDRIVIKINKPKL